MPRPNISPTHTFSGTYEIDTITAIDRIVQPGCVCYDLGASVGYMSLLMARTARHVYAFEPAPHAAAEIRRQAAVNGYDNITIVPQPVSDREKTVSFSLTDVAYGSAIVAGPTKWPTLNLTTVTLDDFAAKNLPPDFIKIDVEGEEARVLLGALPFWNSMPRPSAASCIRRVSPRRLCPSSPLAATS